MAIPSCISPLPNPTNRLPRWLFSLLLSGLMAWQGDTAQAQRLSSEAWHQGEVLLLDGQKRSGKINYSFSENRILVQTPTQTFTYFSDKVLSFSIYDLIRMTHRQFYSLPYEVQAEYKKRIFFELIYENDASLLVREKLVAQTYRDPMNPTMIVTRGYVEEDEYYLINPNGQIDRFIKERKFILRYVGKIYKDKMKDFMKKNKIDVLLREDMIKVVAFYNELIDD